MTMLELLEESPIIAAIKSWEGLEKSLKSECKVVFVLFGTICDIDQIVARIKDAGKVAIVHVHHLTVKAVTDLIVRRLIAKTSLGEETKIRKVKEANVQDSVARIAIMAIQLFLEKVEDVQDSHQMIQDLKDLHVRFVEEAMIMIQMLSIAKRKELSIKNSLQTQMNLFV
jgi:glycerol-3-phosphate responsive antiterminator